MAKRMICFLLALGMVLAILPAQALAAEDTVPMYRLYNPNSGEHFYTGSEAERDMLTDVGWNYEGIGWFAPTGSGEPVYRTYNPNAGDHHYTMSWDEVEMLVDVGWQYEGVCWNSAPATQIPLYRLYNPNAVSGSHHYTNSVEERDWLVSLGWQLEGIGWFGLDPAGKPSEPSKPTEPTQPVQPTVPETTVPEETVPEETVPTEFDKTLSGARVVIDGQVSNRDIRVKDGVWYLSSQDVQSLFGVQDDRNYVNLKSLASAQNISYEQDEVLKAAYFHTYETYFGSSYSDYYRAFTLGLAEESWKGKETEQITSKQYRDLLANLIRKCAPEEMGFFDEMVTQVDKPLTRSPAFIMAFYAGVCLDQNYNVTNTTIDLENADDGNFWGYDVEANRDLLPHAGDGPVVCGWKDWPKENWDVWNDYATAAYLWAFWHTSPTSGDPMFYFDWDNMSTHQTEPLTVLDAISTLTRLYDGTVSNGNIFVEDPKATQMDDCLTTLLPEAVKKAPAISAENHPRWTGFVMSALYDYDFDTLCKDIPNIADWGFNMIRLNLDYQSMMDKDVTTVDTQILQKLDAVISAAIDNNLHLNICFTTLPGRRVEKNMENYTYSGEFDLFINPAKQAQADKLLSLFARRYQQVPSAYLSFTPTWESTNKSLSSGLEAPEYTTDDVGRYLSHVIDLIHSIDSDRMIIAEPSENIFMGDIPTVYTPIYQYIKDKEYTITSYNFCEDPYVYAGMNATPGQHIDHNNQGVQIPSYPATVYYVRNTLNNEKNLIIDGFLPAGTRLEVYLSNSDGNGDFLILGDGQELYREALTSQDFNAGYPISDFYHYATSDKCISITLEQDMQEMKLCAGEGLYHVGLSGIDVTLPEEYAVDRWYHATQYDVFLGNAEAAGPYKKRTSSIMICPNDHELGERVTVREDVTYISDQIWTQANADTIAQRAQEIQKISGNCVIRVEDAGFSGTTWGSMAAYYTDFYEMCTTNGFGWLSNDWMNLCFSHWQQQYIAEAPGYIQYKGYDSFHIELLKLLQKYQS